MTKKKIAQPKRRTKRAAEKPVDKEIQRAAERAGIRPFTSRDRAARNLVGEIHHRLWQVRWELGLHGNGVKVSERDVDHVTDEMTKTAAGGAS